MATPTRTMFLQHEVAPVLDSPLLTRICANWVRLNASPDAHADVQRWALEYPDLAGMLSPADILDRIADGGSQTKDQLLRTLLHLTHSGERLAGEILLQTMLPLLTTMPTTLRSPRGEEGYEEALQRVLAAFWEVAATTHHDRPGVAGRLRMDTLHLVTAHRRSSDAWELHTVYTDAELTPSTDEWGRDERAGADQSTAALSPGQEAEPGPEGELIALLLWMRDTGRFTAEEAHFFGEVYLVHHGDQLAAARRFGLSHAATRKRTSRLRSRLCRAVNAQAQPRHELTDWALAG